ncbi:DUF4278 domain-containing protein [Geminocystis herdmanii]|uniref:DUF4278 domain-containing protein n=1 Tax=Geminocystis herdmanii TaxID=669359 RepID=UPI00034C908B|nr:DUF4278 domain-containing protein [Geminocystis herdmanii]
MKMKYRGNQYKSETSLLEMKEGDIIGKYRGCNVYGKLPRHIPQLRPKLGLSYRGVSYSTCPNATPLFYPQETSSIVKQHCAIAPHSTIPSAISHQKLEEVHLENLRRNLERRMLIAEATQNDYLLEMLRKESQQLLAMR